jgi:ribose-phosphate pyrophosphokinase
MIKLNGKEVKFGRFPNGETMIDHKGIRSLVRSENLITFKYEEDGDLIKLMFLKNYLDENCRRNIRFSLAVNYMPYSRMDRTEEGSAFTLKYVSNFINSLNFEAVEIIEPHSDVTPALINRSASNYLNFKLIDKVKKLVEFDEENDYIMFPDAGAGKRYSKMKASNIVVGNKVRDFATGRIKGLELVGDTSKAYGRSVIIVDDLSSFGGTFVHSADKLREEGFANIYLLVAHAENGMLYGNPHTNVKLLDHVEKVFTTDTLLSDESAINIEIENGKLHLFKIEGVL